MVFFSSPHVLTGRAASGGYLKVLAGEDIKAGTQIFIPYSGGKPRSDRFIQDYGFLDLPGCAKQVYITKEVKYFYVY